MGDVVDPTTGKKTDPFTAIKNKQDFEKMKADYGTMPVGRGELGYTGPGYQSYEQSPYEKAAGVRPPGFRGLTDIGTGELLDRYKVNPFAGEASQKLKSEALGQGPSPWALMALQQQKMEESQARGSAGLQAQTAQAQGQSQLARSGGIGSGARTSLARSGMRDQLLAQQGISQQGAMARYGINTTDQQRRQQLLGQTADVERAGDVNTQQQYLNDLAAKAKFESNRYNQQMTAYGAAQTAEATRNNSGGGGKK